MVVFEVGADWGGDRDGSRGSLRGVFNFDDAVVFAAAFDSDSSLAGLGLFRDGDGVEDGVEAGTVITMVLLSASPSPISFPVSSLEMPIPSVITRHSRLQFFLPSKRDGCKRVQAVALS